MEVPTNPTHQSAFVWICGSFFISANEIRVSREGFLCTQHARWVCVTNVRIYLRVGDQYPYCPLCGNRTYILSRRQAYQHTQDVRLSSIGSGTGKTCATEDAYGGLRWRLEDAKACTRSAHRWAVGSSRGGSHGQGSPACDCPPARGRTWVAGAWLLRAVT